ncbi:MAG TPA: KUP/HAK/KT family potassium transporter, partial [Acidimicrobiales bacterium]|nr:KUP/HAK/KT family potassium transporter [Acidimicrobiales bacterium]
MVFPPSPTTPLAGEVRTRRSPQAVPRPSRGRSTLGFLAISALGVVFGDIGTSPLYAVQTVFTIDHGRIHPVENDVLGIVSLIFWSLLIVVSAKYVGIVMRADNAGEGGVLALASLARRALGHSATRGLAVITLGVAGACLFYGDSIITPAISVLSAVEGLKVPYPAIGHLVLPLSIAVLAGLFLVQSKGTGRVGSLFGPVMVLWFGTIAVAGAVQVARRPVVLEGLSPSYALDFVARHPSLTFVAMGAIVLAITGAEALYADMGHFGRRPITLAWFALVLPALALNYMGQAALVIREPKAVQNPFFILVPSWAQLPMVVLATVATIIASQAVISGAYSMTRQAVQIAYLPAMTVRQTSEETEGQIYMPAVNWLVFVGVLILVLVFRSSARLATAYGVAVTATFLITTVLLLVHARSAWKWPMWRLVAIGIVFGALEMSFFVGNVVKIVDGGWLTVTVAVVLFVVMTTWAKGRARVTSRRAEREGSLGQFIDEVNRSQVPRVPGTAVYPHPNSLTAPLAMRATLEHYHVLHERVVIITARAHDVPHILADHRWAVDDLGYTQDGIVHVELNYGFFETPDIPATLARLCAGGEPLLEGVGEGGITYF